MKIQDEGLRMHSTVPTAAELVSGPDSANPFRFSPALAELLRQRPLSRMEYPDGHLGWIATSRAAVRAVLSDHRFSVNPALMHLPSGAVEAPSETPPGAFTDLDPPDHTRYRKLLTGKFTTRRMQQLAERIGQLAADQLDAMERHGPPADLVTTFARPIPALMICELLGVSYDQREQFQDDAMALASAELTANEFASKFASLQAFMFELVTAKRANPGDDLLSDLLSDLLDTDLTDTELAVIGLVLLGAGFDTTANALALGTFALLLHPDQLAAVPEDPERAVEELLRYLSVIPLTVRAALDDVEIDGQTISRGDTVTVSLLAANRDPEQYDDPDVLDVRREPHGHTAFGHGIHQCLGQQLARVEMRIALPALIERFPTLQLAVSPEKVRLRPNALITGLTSLPVTW